MPDTNEMQRFDALLDAMLTKPPLEDGAGEQAEDDLREEDEG